MHILLTDILSCPRCGPDYGLVLLADSITNRRVVAGMLGCPNCHAKYSVRNGAGNFGSEPTTPAGAPSAEAAIRLAALTGITHGSRYVLLAGPAALHASPLAALLEGLEVITVAEPADGAAPSGETPGVNPIGIATRLPFAGGRLAGVALTGTFADSLLDEGARVLAPVGRLLLDPAPADADERLRAAGLRVVARDVTAIVATRVI